MHIRRPAVIVLAATALLGACADDDEVTGTATAPIETTAADDTGGTPERIVSLSPTATEMLFAVGAGDQVVAVDDQSDYPEGVPVTDLSAYEPNVEAIAAYEPDLVVISGGPEDLVDGLEAVGAEVLTLPAAVTLDDTYAQLIELGTATGHAEEAAAVVEDIEADIAELVAQVPAAPADPPTYYHELDDQLYSVTSSTFIGQLYALAGLHSIADAADPDGALGGYPQLSAEYLVDADPDFVFLADTECCAQDATTFAARPGFADLSAVASGQVVLLSDDVSSRWGPRVVDLLRTIIEATASAA